MQVGHMEGDTMVIGRLTKGMAVIFKLGLNGRKAEGRVV